MLEWVKTVKGILDSVEEDKQKYKEVMKTGTVEEKVYYKLKDVSDKIGSDVIPVELAKDRVSPLCKSMSHACDVIYTLEEEGKIEITKFVGIRINDQQ